MKQIIDYQKEALIQRRLEKVNKGYTFENINEADRKYKIEFLLEVSMNLEGKDEEIAVKHNLPFIDNYSYSYEDGEVNNLKAFFSALNEFAVKPFYILRSFNRKNKFSDYEIKQQIPIRDTILNFADINIVVYEQAKEWLKSNIKEDVSEFIKGILDKQREATQIEKNAIDKFIYLLEQAKELKDKLNGSAYHHNHYDNREDTKTIKFGITKKEYNDRLKIIENKLKTCTKKFGLLQIPTLEYEKINKKPSYKDYIKENEYEIKEVFDVDNQDMNYKDFCKMQYETYLESGDFDE